MRRFIVAIVLVAAAPTVAFADESWSVWFSPNGGCEKAVVAELERAQHEVLVQAYSFSDAAIARALVDASRRGVTVKVLLDKSNQTNRYSAATFLVHAGVATDIDAAHAIAHNKVIIVDEKVVITGSFNFTRRAEHENAENLLVLRDAKLAARYVANWRAHLAHSHPYAGVEARAP